jgi:hypothetical protein
METNWPNVTQRLLRVLAATVLVFEASCAGLQGSENRVIRVMYRVTFLGRPHNLPVKISYAAPGGTRSYSGRLPWQSAPLPLPMNAAVRLEATIPHSNPSGDLQCEINTDEPGSTYKSVTGKRCVLTGQLPFAS